MAEPGLSSRSAFSLYLSFFLHCSAIHLFLLFESSVRASAAKYGSSKLAERLLKSGTENGFVFGDSLQVSEKKRLCLIDIQRTRDEDPGNYCTLVSRSNGGG